MENSLILTSLEIGRKWTKKEEGVAGFKRGEFRCTQAGGYCHASCLLTQPL